MSTQAPNVTSSTRYGSSPLAVSLVSLGVPVVAFTVLNRLLLSRLVLAEDSYSRPWLLPEVLQYLCTSPSHSLGIIVLLCIMSLNGRTWLRGWNDQSVHSRVRFFVVLVALLWGWLSSAHEFNFYYGQSHMADRLLVLILAGAVGWRPAAIVPLLLVSWPALGQFSKPLGGFAWTVVYLPARLLLLFVCVHGTRSITQRFANEQSQSNRSSSQFPLLACVLVAAHYFTPGIHKLLLGWFPQNHTHLLLVNTHAGGWLHFLSTDQVNGIAQTLQRLNPVLNCFTFVAEVGSLLMCWNFRTARSLALIWVLLHIGICAFSGIFFWPWIIIDALLVACFCRSGGPLHNLTSVTDGNASDLNTQHQLVMYRRLISICLIATGGLWTNAVPLSWFDSPVTYSHRFTALLSDGSEQALPTSIFSPYDYPVTLNNFGVAIDGPTLGITWGAIGTWDELRQLRQLTSPRQVIEAEQQLGVARFDAAKRERLERFLATFLRHGRYSNQQPTLPLWMPSIIQNWTDRNMPSDKKVVGIRVERVLSAYLNGQSQTIKVAPVIEVRSADE